MEPEDLGMLTRQAMIEGFLLDHWPVDDTRALGVEVKRVIQSNQRNFTKVLEKIEKGQYTRRPLFTIIGIVTGKMVEKM